MFSTHLQMRSTKWRSVLHFRCVNLATYILLYIAFDLRLSLFISKVPTITVVFGTCIAGGAYMVEILIFDESNIYI